MDKSYNRYSQNDIRWNRKRIGTTTLTIGGHGCLITCIAMACGKTPTEVEKELVFTTKDHPLGGGLILWEENQNKEYFKKLGLEFVERYQTFSEEKVQDYCEQSNMIPIIQVQTKNGGVHWVLPIGKALTWRGKGWATNDPWSGKREWKTVGFGAPYVRTLGWVLLQYI